MRRTLSHSSNRLFRLLSGRPLPGSASRLAATLLLALSPLGCNNIDSESAATSQSALEEEEISKAFEWPADPSHPVLSLDIESPAVEGRIHIELMPELAPMSVAEIIKLAGDGFYNGTTFHRVIRGFMIQGGDQNSRDRDPTNDGKGRGKVRLVDEFGPAPFERGVVGIANTGRKDSNSTQFFIIHQDSRNIDGRYTVIGRVVDGIEVVDEITQVATDKVGRWGPKDRPIENVVMKSVQLSGQIGALVESGAIVLAKGDGQTESEPQPGFVDGSQSPAAAAGDGSPEDTVTAAN